MTASLLQGWNTQGLFAGNSQRPIRLQVFAVNFDPGLHQPGFVGREFAVKQTAVFDGKTALAF